MEKSAKTGGFLSYDNAQKKLILRQFHVEGFVNQYVMESESPSEVVFISESIENIASGWLLLLISVGL